MQGQAALGDDYVPQVLEGKQICKVMQSVKSLSKFFRQA